MVFSFIYKNWSFCSCIIFFFLFLLLMFELFMRSKPDMSASGRGLALSWGVLCFIASFLSNFTWYDILSVVYNDILILFIRFGLLSQFHSLMAGRHAWTSEKLNPTKTTIDSSILDGVDNWVVSSHICVTSEYFDPYLTRLLNWNESEYTAQTQSNIIRLAWFNSIDPFMIFFIFLLLLKFFKKHLISSIYFSKI